MSKKNGTKPEVKPETHKLYDGKVELLYYPDPVHRYEVDGEALPGVTTILKDTLPKPALIQWAANLASEYWLNALREDAEAYPADEQFLPSVDIVASLVGFEKIEQLHDLARFAWRKTAKEAADIGTAAHDWIANFLKGDTHPLDFIEPVQVRNCVTAFCDWWGAKPRAVVAVERIVYSRSLGYAGRFDLLTEEDDEFWLTDFKSSKGIYDTEYLAQLTGLCKALNEELPFGSPCYKRRIVRLGKEDGSFEVREYDDSQYCWDIETWVGMVNTYGWLKNRFKESAE